MSHIGSSSSLMVSACWQRSGESICSLVHAFTFIQADVRHGYRQQNPHSDGKEQVSVRWSYKAQD